MDVRHREEKPKPSGNPYPFTWLIRLPLQICLDFINNSWRSFRASLPQLIPLLVFLVSLPILVFCSVSAGWFVWRSIAVGWEASLWLQYGDGVSPYAQVPLPALSSQQPYDVSLLLILPPSPANFELGNFMTTLTIANPNNDTIAAIRRPSLVLSPSAALWSFLLGRANTITVDIPLLKNIVLGTNNAVAYIEVGRKDQWRSLGRGEGRELTVSSAKLRGVVVHKGLRGLFTRFPLITAMSASGVFFIFSFTMLASCLLPMIEWRVQGSTEAISPTSDKPPRRVKRETIIPVRAAKPKRSRSLGTAGRDASLQSIVKEEEPPTPIASSSRASTPLRRRRSRLSSDNE